MNQAQVLKPLKTWSHLAARRRKPSEYEIVSANLHYTTRPGAPAFELDPDLFANRWYKKHRDESPLVHSNWNAFRDPDEIIYRTYNMMQDGAETYVMGLFDQFNQREHDKSLAPTWAGTLARLYAPSRYLFHTMQMCSGYIAQIAPASTISLCAAFQSADSLRWLSHCAYRTKELSGAFPEHGFARDERKYWESDPAWQGVRELMERVLATYDWAEAFVALNLVAKPAIEEAVQRKLGEAARHNGDILLGLLTDSQSLDGARHRRWAAALVKLSLEVQGNAQVIQRWFDKWVPLADKAVDIYCAALPDVVDAGESTKQAAAAFRSSLSVSS